MARDADLVEAAVSAPIRGRHSSVSWNLMAGKNPLWVAKQHGHSITTMLRVYAAWAEDMVESDVDAIRRSMNRHAQRRPATTCDNSGFTWPEGNRGMDAEFRCPARTKQQRALGSLAVRLPIDPITDNVSVGKKGDSMVERGALEPAGRVRKISNLLTPFEFRPPPLPSNTGIWHSIGH
jgi:hypothetical protein